MELALSSLMMVGVMGLVFLVALLYSAVGHGGASGYLALLSMWGVPAQQMATSALILNIIVSGIAMHSFAQAGHFSFKLVWPFALASIPAAWIGGWWHVSPYLYDWLLIGVLLMAAWRLWTTFPSVSIGGHPQLATALGAGAGIGLLSGIVGIGGGILLSPLLIFKRWADAKQAAATSACFILVNSAAGLLGRLMRGSLPQDLMVGPILAAVLGGILGSRLGARHFSALVLRRVLACVLVVAAFKVVSP